MNRCQRCDKLLFNSFDVYCKSCREIIYMENQEQEKKRLLKAAEERKREEKIGYFSNEKVKCDSYIDENVFVLVHDALIDSNFDTENEENMKDALSTHDENVYQLCSAIIYQNFMLMRKVDSLSEKLSELEGYVNNLSHG